MHNKSMPPICMWYTCIPYSWKIWRGIKFGGLAVCLSTAKLKSAKLFSTCMYVRWYHTIPPNLNPPIVWNTSFGAKLPNLMTANISSYTVCTVTLCNPVWPICLLNMCTTCTFRLQVYLWWLRLRLQTARMCTFHRLVALIAVTSVIIIVPVVLPGSSNIITIALVHVE